MTKFKYLCKFIETSKWNIIIKKKFKLTYLADVKIDLIL